MKNSNKFNIILIGTIISLCSFLVTMFIKEGHNWGDDFSLYISEAKAITEFNLKTVYLENKFTVDHSAGHVSPYITPLGFPFLLSPLYYLFGCNLIIFKWYCAFFFLASIPLSFLLFKDYFKKSIFVYLILIYYFFNPHVLKITDSILSDFPFLFFCFLFLILLKQKNSFKNQILIGICLGFTLFIREIGIVLIPTLISFQYFQMKEQNFTSKEKRLLIIPYLLLLFSFILTSLLFPPRGTSQFYQFLENINLTKIAANLSIYQLLIQNFMHSSSIVFWIIFTLFCIGVFSCFKNTQHFIIFFICYLGILLFWDADQGIRFLLPLIPFFLFYILQGALFMTKRLNPYYFIIVISFFMMKSTRMFLLEAFDAKSTETNQAFTEEMCSIYRFISENTTPNEIIGFRKARVLRLNTHRNTICTNFEFFKHSIANYLLIHKKEVKENKYITVFSTDNYLLLKKEAIIN